MKVREINGDYGSPANKPAKTRKKFKRLKFWLKSILMLGLVSGTMVLLGLSPLFNISEIEVQGNRHYSSRTIAEVADISMGNNGFKTIGKDLRYILLLRYGEAEERILKNCPYAKDVTVRYKIPGKILIDMVERDVMCIVHYLGTSLVLDYEGYVLDTVKDTVKQEFPSVKGLKFEYYELGKKLVLENPGSIDKVVQVLKAVNDADNNDEFKIFELVESIDVSDDEKVFLFIDSRLAVNLGDLQDINYRINMLKHIFLRNIKNTDKGLLDFTAGENPVLRLEK